MGKTIDIREFKGVFTNGDAEDVAVEFCQVMENLRPANGKLVKTFGAGAKPGIFASDYPLDNLAAYIHAELPYGFIYVAPAIDVSSNTMVAVFYYAGSGWIALSEEYLITGGPFLHRKGINPIVQAGGILRMLPGNVGEIGGAEAKGFWYGWIDRTYFDGLYALEAGFYGFPVNVDKPALTFALSALSGGTLNAAGTGQIAYYKFSYVYDGVQESLMNDAAASWTCAQNTGVTISFSATYSTMSKRITAMKVYRSIYDTATGVQSPYGLVQIIDFQRETGSVISGSAAFSGETFVYVDNCTYTFDGAKKYALLVASGGSITAYAITNPGAGTHDTFEWGVNYVPQVQWGSKWYLMEETATPGAYTEVAHEDTGLYVGANHVVIETDVSAYDLTGGSLGLSQAGEWGFATIARTYKKVVAYTETGAFGRTDSWNWQIFKPGGGLYAVTDGTTYAGYKFYDTGLTAGEAHPLEGEVSIKINGEFARIIAGRLWQGNIVLDPGGKNEAHDDWVSYSELGQYDVNPVSNVMYIEDREGGPVTGIAEVFGCPVVLKKQAIIFINIRADLNDPARWSVKESAHNIGSLAKQGYVESNGNLYVCHIDGIFRLRPNNLADADATPTERLKITGPIEDVYQALTLAQKEAIKATYEPSRGEIVFTLGVNWWAFNVDTGNWREIVTACVPALFASDENGQVLVYDATSRDIFTLDPSATESVAARWRKTFRVSAVRKETVREIEVTYKSAAILTVNIYADGASAATWTGTLPVSTVTDAVQIYPRFPAKMIDVEIRTAAGTGAVEIMRVKINHD